MNATPVNPEMPNHQGPGGPASGDKEAELSFIERAIRRLSDRRDVAIWEGDPVKPGPTLEYARDPTSVRSERIRSLRTEILMRLGAHQGAAIFAVVGSREGEGRSQLCAELAMAFAQLFGRTLLVDADLRNSGINRLFPGLKSVGLTEMLLGQAQAMPLHRVVGPQHLRLLATGTPPRNPVDLLSGERFESLVQDWSRSFDYVLIDTPPAALYSDGIVIANAARNVVLVAHRNHTSFADVAALQRRLGSTQARVIGAVLNDF